jgi:hypothetical protein
MIWEWVAEKGTSLLAFFIGLGFIGVSFMDPQYRYFFLCLAVVVIAYGCKRYTKHDTPFEKRDRETKRKQL